MEPISLDDLVQGLIKRAYVGPTAYPIVTGVCTDTRKLSPGDLFFALKGEHSDGHGFVREALASGAAAAVVSEPPSRPPDGPIVLVDETVRFLGEVARNYRRRFDVAVLAITGSVGKTTVKEMASSVLSTRMSTLANEKNFNNEIGVPLTLFQIGGQHQAAVVELGMRAKGEIGWLASIAEPTVALITNVGHSHIERLGTRGAIADAKSELLERLPRDGIALLPRGDEFFERLKARVPAGCRIITFSDDTEARADVVVELIHDEPYYRASLLGERFEITIAGPPARHMARNAAAAIAAGMAFDISNEDACAGILQWNPMEGRLRALSCGDHMTVIDDCYNAAPESMAAALGILSRMPVHTPGRCDDRPAGTGRRVAVLGDIRERGGFAQRLHRIVGREVIDAGVDVLVTVGELAAEVAHEAARYSSQADRPAPLHRHFENSDDAAAEVPSLTGAYDLVLVKGSRAMAMEKVVAALTGVRGTIQHG